MKYLWKGLTKDGEQVSAKIEGSLGKRLDRVDVMEKVPGFIKALVGGVVGTKPYIYQVGSVAIFIFDTCTNKDGISTRLKKSFQ